VSLSACYPSLQVFITHPYSIGLAPVSWRYEEDGNFSCSARMEVEDEGVFPWQGGSGLSVLTVPLLIKEFKTKIKLGLLLPLAIHLWSSPSATPD